VTKPLSSKYQQLHFQNCLSVCAFQEECLTLHLLLSITCTVVSAHERATNKYPFQPLGYHRKYQGDGGGEQAHTSRDPVLPTLGTNKCTSCLLAQPGPRAQRFPLVRTLKTCHLRGSFIERRRSEKRGVFVIANETQHPPPPAESRKLVECWTKCAEKEGAYAEK